jgi:hypothetical protein
MNGWRTRDSPKLVAKPNLRCKLSAKSFWHLILHNRFFHYSKDPSVTSQRSVINNVGGM